MTFNVLLLAGDGIGPEIMQELEKIIHVLNEKTSLSFHITHDYIGGAGYDHYGYPCADHIIEKAKSSDATFLACVGGPKWDSIPFDKKPERGLLRLRKDLDLFANLRPALCFEALSESSTLKKDIISGLDIIIVRELTSGVYFGEPRGISGEAGHRIGIDTQYYTEAQIERVAHSAFETADKRNKKVTSCEKANVMQSGVLWRDVVTHIHKKHYAHIELEHMYADNAAMQLVRNPKQFDVILTDNLFGDILSDVAAMLTGSLGMLPSASLGKKQGNHLPALYEPVHGSAPDIAGENKANPLAMILSFTMALRLSFNAHQTADLIDNIIQQILEENIRTPDIANNTSEIITTSQMGDKIVHALNQTL